MYAPQLVDIYIEAMGYDPRVRNNRIATWRREVIQPGFTAIIAEAESTIIGLAYGFLGSPDTWWDRQLRRGFSTSGGITEERRDILSSYFELAEIHVCPTVQGHGVGRSLLRELAWNVPARHILLSTPEVNKENNAAFALYRSEGFRDILRHYYYPSDSRAFAILGARLPLHGRASVQPG